MPRPQSVYDGDKFGKWTVEEARLPKKNNTRVRCECGTVKEVTSHSLTSGKSTRCRRCASFNSSGNAPRRRTGNLLAANDKFTAYRKGARDKSRVWELTFDDFMKITQENCFYCGVEPCNVNRIPEKEWAEDFRYNGIDRINSREGYLLDNVQPCCWRCNYMKREKSQDDFLRHARRIVDYRDKRNNEN